MNNDKIIENQIKEYEYFLKNIGIVSVDDVNLAIRQNKITDLIMCSENRHYEIIKRCCNDILSKKDCKIILITGPSSSGKTTFAGRLCNELKRYGVSTLSISLDHYYKPLDEIPLDADGKPDIEDIEAFEYELLNSHICELIDGKSVYMPYYDFQKRLKAKDNKAVSLLENDIIIVEGIHAFNPKIAKDISSERKYFIYCSALNSLNDKNGNRIKSEQTRQMRRFVRDYYFRNADYKLSFDLWDNVEVGSKKNIYPYTEKADMVFNSAAFYEYSLYKKHLDIILKDALDDHIYKEKALTLLSSVADFESLADNYVPADSIIREFIG